MHLYGIDQIASWLRDGVIWWVLAWTPLRNLVTVPTYPPAWWYEWFSYQDYDSNSDSDRHPYPRLAELWLLGLWRVMGRWVDESIHATTDSLNASIFGTLGGLNRAYTSFAAWISSLETRLGGGMVSWATSLVGALDRVFAWLPDEVKFAGRSWAMLFDSIVDRAQSWAHATFDGAARNAVDSWNWLSTSGTILATWFNQSRATLDRLVSNFRGEVLATLGGTWGWLEGLAGNPYSTLAGILGSTWLRLVAFDRDALSYWYNLWGAHSRDLSEFLSSPGQWIADKALEEIKRIW